jgi:hypothetical protein
VPRMVLEVEGGDIKSIAINNKPFSRVALFEIKQQLSKRCNR